MAAERLGGAFLKGAQILSTRVDLLPIDTISALSRLRDNVATIPYCDIEPLLTTFNPFNGDVRITAIDPEPLASGTIAQVHIGTDANTGHRIALKVRRPGISQLLETDASYIRFFARMLSSLPWLRRLPIRESTDEICLALVRQADFLAETQMFIRFRSLFIDNTHVRIPSTIDCLCTADVIVMDYLSDYYAIRDLRGNSEIAKSAVLAGLRALYKMIFNAGLVHCDLHAGNILGKADGTIALLDFGFVAEMTPKAKHDFAEFFLCIAFRDGKTAAKIVKESALRVSEQLNILAFEQEMQTLVDKAADKRAAD